MVCSPPLKYSGAIGEEEGGTAVASPAEFLTVGAPIKDGKADINEGVEENDFAALVVD